MNKVSQKKVDRLKRKMNGEIPDLEIVYKDEEWPNHWMLTIIQLFVGFVGLFSSSFKDKFYNRMGNAFGKFLLLPNREEYSDWTDPNVHKMVRHEFVHLMDYKETPLAFVLTYVLFPLPTIFSGRVYWEIRAYAQNMMVEYELNGKVSDSTLDWIEDHFCSSMYFWMFPFRGLVREELENIREKIESEHVEGFYPDV
jgi:hypothetical protein